MKTKQMIYRELELIPEPTEHPSIQRTFQSWLSKIWSFLVDDPLEKTEPQIWQERDRAGNFWWRAYDPATDRSAWLESEDEVCIWIEQLHYYQSPTFLSRTDWVEDWRGYYKYQPPAFLPRTDWVQVWRSYYK